MPGRCGTGEVVDFVDLDQHWLDDVVAHQLEARMPRDGLEIGFATGEEVVEANDLVPIGEQALTEMRADETSATGNEHSTHELDLPTPT